MYEPGDFDSDDVGARTPAERRRWEQILSPNFTNDVTRVDNDPFLADGNWDDGVLEHCTDSTWVTLFAHPDPDARRCVQDSLDNQIRHPRPFPNLNAIPEVTCNNAQTEQAMCDNSTWTADTLCAHVVEHDLRWTAPLVRRWVAGEGSHTSAARDALCESFYRSGYTLHAVVELLRCGIGHTWCDVHRRIVPVALLAAFPDTLTLDVCYQLETRRLITADTINLVDRHLRGIAAAGIDSTDRLDRIPSRWWEALTNSEIAQLATDHALGNAILAGENVHAADVYARGRAAILAAHADGTLPTWYRFRTAVSFDHSEGADRILDEIVAVSNWQQLLAQNRGVWLPVIYRAVLRADIDETILATAVDLAGTAESLIHLHTVLAHVTPPAHR
jgi:hypothetical protein